MPVAKETHEFAIKSQTIEKDRLSSDYSQYVSEKISFTIPPDYKIKNVKFGGSDGVEYAVRVRIKQDIKLFPDHNSTYLIPFKPNLVNEFSQSVKGKIKENYSFRLSKSDYNAGDVVNISYDEIIPMDYDSVKIELVTGINIKAKSHKDNYAMSMHLGEYDILDLIPKEITLPNIPISSIDGVNASIKNYIRISMKSGRKNNQVLLPINYNNDESFFENYDMKDPNFQWDDTVLDTKKAQRFKIFNLIRALSLTGLFIYIIVFEGGFIPFPF